MIIIILIPYANDIDVMMIIFSYNPVRRLGFLYAYCIFQAFWTEMTLEIALLGRFLKNCEYVYFDLFL